MKLRILTVCLMLVSTWSTTAKAEQSAYVSDQLTVFVHSGPTRNYRIVGTIEAGSPISLIEKSEDGSFSQVEYDNKTGWIESQYVSTEQSLKQKFVQSQQALEKTTAELTEVTNKLNTQQSEQMLLESQLERQQQTNAKLESSVQNYQMQLAQIQQNDAQTQEKVKMDWMIKGGALALGSLVLGYLLALMPRRKKRNPDFF
ncbi:TIGR04211 family SH3 domain-containing protein [Catenovulum agarivorans]|uniref:TIGR04211 family SH3 domain-containing protein n=1 Tax=Catenovulum agarivorans TaxID=1172192 RepID=UPI000372316A|nr:TIGR04211 family SH3 domain-containing protein [Catenovulum agarivorans]